MCALKCLAAHILWQLLTPCAAYSRMKGYLCRFDIVVFNFKHAELQPDQHVLMLVHCVVSSQKLLLIHFVLMMGTLMSRCPKEPLRAVCQFSCGGTLQGG